MSVNLIFLLSCLHKLIYRAKDRPFHYFPVMISSYLHQLFSTSCLYPLCWTIISVIKYGSVQYFWSISFAANILTVLEESLKENLL